MERTITYKSFPGTIDTKCFALNGKIGSYEYQKALEETENSLIYRVTDRITEQDKVLRCWTEQHGMQRQAVRDKIIRAAAGCTTLMPIEDAGIWQVGEDIFYYEIYPFYSMGNLKQLPPKGEEECRKIVGQINEAIHALHKEGLIHGDIKPDNVFWTDHEKKQIVLGDYDITEEMDQKGDVHSLHRGTPEYMPPCEHNKEWLRNTATDYGSLGITVHDLLTGKILMAGKTENEIYREWQYGLSMQAGLPEDFKKLIINLTVFDQNHRWGYEQVRLWEKNQYINEKMSIQSRLLENVGYHRLIIAVEGDRNISVHCLEDLGRMMTRYQEQFKRRFLTEKGRTDKLIDFVRKFDMDKAEEVTKVIRNISKSTDLDIVVFQLSKLFYHPEKNDEINFSNKSYGSVEEIFNQMDEIEPDLELVKLIRHEYKDWCNASAQEEMEKLFKAAGKDNVFLYFLIRYVFGENKEYTIEDRIIHNVEELREYVISDQDHAISANHNKRLLAWLYSMGYAEQIIQYSEVSAYE